MSRESRVVIGFQRMRRNSITHNVRYASVSLMRDEAARGASDGMGGVKKMHQVVDTSKNRD